MDYEKKYKEALERAKDMLAYKEVRQEDMEYLFPELEESEDEKIKREIVAYINELADLKNEKIPSKWLAWIDKQGENKSTEDKTVLAKYFPELKESKDERIKDEILRLVSISGNGNQYEEIRDWIAKLNDKDVIIKEQDALIKDQNELIKELGEYKTKYVRDSIIKSTTKSPFFNCYNPDGNCCTNCPRRYYGAITATTTDTTEEKYDTTVRRANL